MDKPEPPRNILDPSTDANLLDHYFVSVYNKLEADALLFNRRLPHSGMAGAENEISLASLIRDFLPPRFGVEVSGIVIDRHGSESRQCDIVIYDAWNFPKYLRKVFPVELVYAVIEVKTSLTSDEAKAAGENLAALWRLDFRPALTNYWVTRSDRERLFVHPPSGFVFSFRSTASAFETFAGWFPFEMVLAGRRLEQTPYGPEIRSLGVCALDKGLIALESTNLHVHRQIPTIETTTPQRAFEVTLAGKPVLVDPAKVLFFFLESLWTTLQTHRLHPGFDMRSYMSGPMGSFVDAGNVEKEPDDWYMHPTGLA